MNRPLQFLCATPRCLLLATSVSLVACVNTQPKSLTPSITMSTEQVVFAEQLPETQGYDFGLNVVLNESDSLSNIELLPGIRVRAVTENSPASLAGIRVGDVILQIDGQDINQPDRLDALAVQGTEQEKQFEFVVRRNTSVFQTSVNARRLNSNRSAPIELYRADPIATRAGFSTALIDPSTNNTSGINAGVRVVKLFPGSPLPAAGIHLQDIVISLNGEALESAQDFITRVNTEHSLGSKVSVGIIRAHADQSDIEETTLRLWSPGRRISDISLGPLLQYSNTLSPQSTQLRIGDLWLFSLFDYSHNEGETQYSLFSLFKFSSGYGELIEESNP